MCCQTRVYEKAMSAHNCLSRATGSRSHGEKRSWSCSPARSYESAVAIDVYSLRGLREMGDGPFGMVRGHVSMTSLAMLNRVFQLGKRFCDMRGCASSHGLLQ